MAVPFISDINLNKNKIYNAKVETPIEDQEIANKKYVDDKLSPITVVDNLNSVSTTDALSAKQGKVLNDKIESTTTQTVLWDDYSYMNASQTVNVPISEQKNGVMLMFCAYSNGEPHNWNWANFVILKKEAEILNGGGRTFPMGGAQGIDATKYIYIYPNKIEGNDANQQGNSANYVLRKIIGF